MPRGAGSDGVSARDRCIAGWSPLLEVVLVSWTIEADALDKFEHDFPALPSTTPGLIGEEPFRLTSDSGPVVHLLRLGRWRSREDFYVALYKVGTRPFTPPGKMPYEVAPRRREWLTWVRDDTEVPEAD